MNHIADPAKKVEPAKPLSMDEILLSVKTDHDDDDHYTCKTRYRKCEKCGKPGYWPNRVTNCSHGWSKYTVEQDCDCGVQESIDQAKARLIELVESLPAEKVYPLDNGDTMTVKMSTEDFRQSLIKAIEGGEG